MKIDHRRKVHKKHLNNNNNMIIGTQNHCAAANLANSKGGGTDFSIAAIMARGGSSREPSERSISKWTFLKTWFLVTSLKKCLGCASTLVFYVICLMNVIFIGNLKLLKK